MAQFSPPLGPPQAGPAAIPLKTISFGWLTRLVKEVLDSAIIHIKQNINNTSSSPGITANLSYDIQSILPEYKKTEMAAAPNYNFVQLQIQVKYSLSNIRYHAVSFPSRKLSQQINANAWCDKWSTDTGTAKVTLAAEKLYLEESKFAEPALNAIINDLLIPHIHNQLSQAFNNIMSSGNWPLTGYSCNCLNFIKGTGPNFEDGYAGFYYFPVRKIAVAALYSHPQIRLLSIKRFSAPLMYDDSLPSMDDGLQIEYMANFNTDSVKIKAPRENETIYLKDDISLHFEHPNQYGSLIVIVNLYNSNTAIPFLSDFLWFDKDTNYGAGIRKLTLMKKASNLSFAGTSAQYVKKDSLLVPLYELTFNITYDKPSLK